LVNEREVGMPQHNHRARKSNEIREKYNELLLAVTNKFLGETRHQTALRYIKEAEARSLGFRKVSQNEIRD